MKDLEQNISKKDKREDQLFVDKFTREQIEELVEYIQSIENYYRFISIEIKHQEDSINSLPK